MKLKFKKNDRVKIMKNNLEKEYDKYIEQIGIITDVDENNLELTYLILFNDGSYSWWSEDEIILSEPSVADIVYKHLNEDRCSLHMKNKKQTYIAGDLLKKGSVLLREQEARDLRNVGVRIYSPIEDKEINDKKNQSKESNNGLAEKIVKKDTDAIINSDYIVIEPQDDAKGTMVELGQIKGMKDASKMIMDVLTKFKEEGKEDYFELVKEMGKLAVKLDKKVYPHYEDIRRTNIEECGDRRSLGINQYVYGVCLDLTNGKGFYEWEDIVNEMKKEYSKVCVYE